MQSNPEKTYKLLALDLDGTVLDANSQIPAQNARAVQAAKEQGVQIVLCTGRHLADARLFSDQLITPADWVVTANGADVRRPNGDETVFSAPLERVHCQAILEVCERFGTDPCFYTTEKLYFGWAFQDFLKDLGKRGHPLAGVRYDMEYCLESMSQWRALLQAEEEAFVKAILYHPHPQTVDAMQEALAQTGLFDLAPSVMYGGALKNVEINRRGVHKGRALAALAAHLGLTMEAVVAMGDSDNDLTMLQMAGLGVAMGDAEAHIRQAADAVTLPGTENGVAHAIQQYILRGSL